VTRILAIDAGTTGVRAIVFDESGARQGSGYRELAMTYPRPGWAEQNPEEIWRGTCGVIAEALSSARLSAHDVDAVGITNQRSSVMAWDARTLSPLSAMLSWQDIRAVDRANELQAQGFFVTPNVSVTKAEWILRNVPEVREAARLGSLRFGGVEAWIAANLTGGAHVCDHANASATGFYAHLENAWDRALLEAVEIQESALPRLVPCAADLAKTSEDSFGARVTLAAMCGDQQAALFGLACTEVGSTKCSYGTSAMVDCATGSDLSLRGPAVYPLVAWTFDGDDSTTWCVEGSVITAGAAVQWLRDALRIADSAAAIGSLAAGVPDSAGVWVVPALQGLGTPFADSGARGLIGGLSRGSERAHVARALLEGIAHRVCDVTEAVWQGASVPSALRADGGASRNDLLMQLQADVLGLPVERSAEPDGSALGVARLAACGAALCEQGDAENWKPDRVFEPSTTSADRHAARELWRARVPLASLGS
jgi:glycerol kinase